MAVGRPTLLGRWLRVLRTKVTVIDDNKDVTLGMAKRLEKLRRSYVTVGVHEDAGKYTGGKNPPSVVEVALWNEFGTSTTPERSFIRSAIDGNEATINRWIASVVDKVAFDEMSVREALEWLGFQTQVLIQNKIKSNVPPPNAASTQRHKAQEGKLPKKFKGASVGKDVSLLKSHTLIDTELLLRSITYKVYEG